MPLISLYSASDRVLKGRVQKSTVLHEDVVSSRSYFNTCARVCDSLFGVSVGKCAHEAMVLVFQQRPDAEEPGTALHAGSRPKSARSSPSPVREPSGPCSGGMVGNVLIHS